LLSAFAGFGSLFAPSDFDPSGFAPSDLDPSDFDPSDLDPSDFDVDSAGLPEDSEDFYFSW